MSKSNAYETAFLNNLLLNATIPNVGDATGLRGSTATGSLYLSLHTADPGEAGDQSTSEIGYTGYARVAVARTAGGFSVSGNAGSLVANAVFPAGTGGSGTAAFWGLGTSPTGAGTLLFKGAISPTIVCGAGITPQINAGTLVTED
jgi:hypothetical protein